MGGSIVINGFLIAERALKAHELGWLDDAAQWGPATLNPRYSFVIGPLATFERPLQDEELPTLALLPRDEWAIDMDLLPARGDVELTTFALRRPDTLSAPSLARRHANQMRRDRG